MSEDPMYFRVEDATESYFTLRRAICAYLRHDPFGIPEFNTSGHFIINVTDSYGSRDLEYVRINSKSEILAVYRVTNLNKLKRLRRWPASVENGTATVYAERNAMKLSNLEKLASETPRTENNEEIFDFTSIVIENFNGKFPDLSPIRVG